MLGRVLSMLLLGGAVALPVKAQVTIRVVGSSGQPLPAVRVDVLGRGELIATYSTSAQGVAELNAERWSDARRITFSHLGFQTLVVQTGEIPADGVIHLEPEAIRIEGFSVLVSELCPVADEPRARRLWSEVASLYAEDTGARAWLAYLSLYSGSVRQDDLYRTSDIEPVSYVAAGGPEVAPGGSQVRRSIEDRILADGYAWSPLGLGGTREVAWRYPKLDREVAYHFATPIFGALHDFAVLDESENETSLVFCGNERATGATTSGLITLVPGESFLVAEWRFQTEAPDEGAGGSVSFTSVAEGPGMKPHLVAADGSFYRHSGTEVPYPNLPRTYARFGTAQARWYLLPSADRPCNNGLSFFGDPPSSTDPAGVRFAACVEEHWGRE